MNESQRAALVGVFIVVAVALALALPSVIDRVAPAPVVGSAPTAGESRAIGWAPPEAAGALAADLFQRVNDERAARGAPPLTWHAGLADIAERWSVEMISSGRFEHSPETFRTHPSFSATGENILMGHETAGEAHVGWMTSDGHREAILLSDFDAIGIGVVCRGDGRMWATQVFGIAARRTSPRSPVDTAVEPIVRRDEGVTCRSVLADTPSR
ncbi:MAG: CAP domain-containing protein [Nitriliruptor sp.]|uniref:CAP domain-containing protein n=1 Tax=Nitriliruptor sp. TaxID=2448056 RepID=UPI0034A055ED